MLQADAQAHDLASALEDNAELAPEVHHRRVPLANDIGEDSGESSGRVRSFLRRPLSTCMQTLLLQAVACSIH
jgi:hypothetical protein